jgi:integrase
MRDPSTALEGVIDTFMWSKRAERISPETERWYRVFLESFVHWLRAEGREGTISDLDAPTARAYVAHRLIHGEKGPGSPFQARASAVALKALSSYLAREGITKNDALALVKVPRVDDQTRTELTSEQFAQVMKAAERGRNRARDKAILTLMIVCGLRLNETRLLTLEDVDFDQGVIHIRPETSKFRKGRYVTLYPDAAAALVGYVFDHRRGPGNALFLTEHGGNFTRDGFARVFRSLRARGGLAKFSAHLLRHTAASGFMRAQTGNVIELQRQFGWSDIRMAMRYVHETEAKEMVSRPSPLAGLKGAVKRSVAHKGGHIQRVSRGIA